MVDFNIEKDSERVEEVKKELSHIQKPTTTQLETLANYILYGKDSSGKNSVEKGDIQIETKYNSFKKKKAESLDELMESPVFNENDVSPIHKTVYKNPKPTLDKDLPGMQPLLQTIEYYEDLKSKYESEPETPSLKTKIWKISHTIISLRKEQYILQKMMRPPLVLQNVDGTHESDEPNIVVKPLGLKIGDSTRFLDPKNDESSLEELPEEQGLIIDLENPSHLYQIFEFWQPLYEASLSNPYHNTKYLLETVEFYTNKTLLDQSRKDIIYLKKMRYSNAQIKNYLQKNYGTNYNENYISTIFTKEICRKISETVTLHKDEWAARKNPDLWKRCSCCGEWKLKDPRNFVRKKNSSDGYTAQCKSCNFRKRQEGKNK